jgi:DNA-binding transcriptional LysR family regulator
MPLISPGALCFDEVARQGSIRRAAERLNASPSAVNRQVINLETEYGVPLFERLPRGVRLTAAGEVLIEEVRRWRRDLYRARHRLEQLKGTRSGLVSVGTIECLATDFTPAVFRKIQDLHPGIALSGMIDSTQNIVRALLTGTIDVAVSFTVPTMAGIDRVMEVNAPIGAVMSPEHPLAKRRSLRLSELPNFPILIPEHSMPIRTAIDESFSNASVVFSPALTSNSTTLLKEMAKHGGRIAVISKVDAYAELQTGELVFVPIESRHLKQGPLSLSRRQGQVASAIISTVIEAFRHEITAALSW